MKTYFNYEDIIRSKDAGEAIASPVGIGPFCGFGSATIANQSITLHAKGKDGTVTQYPVADLIRARRMYKGDSDISVTNFGVVASDGTIFTESEENIAITTIQGTEGITGDVIVFAVHQQITEPVDNPVTFVAYHNSSSTSFYDLYKRSQNPYYPSSSNQEFVNKDIFEDSDLSYESLCNRVEAAVGSNLINWDTMVLVGIYGRGTDSETQTSEDYAIVPYGGRFPQPLSYNTAVYGAQKKQASMLETLLADIPSNQSLLEYLKSYIQSLLSGSDDEGTVLIPSGTIVLYNGTVAPDGWAICDGSNGTPDLRGVFIIGAGVSTDGRGYNLGDKGGNSEVMLTGQNIPKHTHKFMDYYNMEASHTGTNWVDMGVNNIAGTNGGLDNDNRYALYQEHDTYEYPASGEQAAINIMPPYMALNYIMKL